MPWNRHALTRSSAAQVPEILTRTYYARRPRPVDPRQADTRRLLAAGVIGAHDVVGQELPAGFAWRGSRGSRISVPSVPVALCTAAARIDPTRPDPDERRAHHNLTAAIDTWGLLT